MHYSEKLLNIWLPSKPIEWIFQILYIHTYIHAVNNIKKLFLFIYSNTADCRANFDLIVLKPVFLVFSSCCITLAQYRKIQQRFLLEYRT